MDPVLNFFELTSKCSGTSPIATKRYLFIWLFRMYCTLLIICFVMEAVWIHYGKLTTNLFDIYIMTRLLDMGVTYVMCALHVSAIFPTLRGKNRFYTYFNLITEYVDKLLNYSGPSEKENLKRKLIIILAIAATVVVYLIGFCVELLNNEFAINKYFIVTYLNKSIIFLMIYQMTVTVNQISKRFELMNEKLLTVALEGTTFKRVIVVQRSLKDIDTLMKVHISLCELVEKFSKQYGYRILLTLVFVCLLLLQNIETYLNHYHKYGGKYDLSIMLQIVIGVHFMSCSVVLAHYCEKNYRETRKSGPLLYKLLLKTWPESSDRKKLEDIVRSNLIALAEQTVQRNVEVTAAGFFPINYSLIYGMAGTVLSYLVIIIQLKDQYNQKT